MRPRRVFLVGDRVKLAWEAFRDGLARYNTIGVPIAVRAGPAARIHPYPLSADGAPRAIDVTTAAVWPVGLVRVAAVDARRARHATPIVSCATLTPCE